MLNSWKKHFPFKKIRKQQKEAIEFALRSWKAGKRHVLIEAGTGVGKSAIAICLARTLNMGMHQNAYAITCQKSLQKQYEDSFHDVKSICASSNFRCHAVKGMNCGQTLRIKDHLGFDQFGNQKKLTCQSRCPYRKARNAFLGSPISVTNYAYFLASTMYGAGIEPRGLLILDEAHNLENELTSWIGLRVSKSFCQRYSLDVNFPTDLRNKGDAKKWLVDILEPCISKQMKDVQQRLERADLSHARTLQKTAKEYDELDRMLCAIHRLDKHYSDEKWIISIDSTPSPTISLKPIYAGEFAEKQLYSYGEKTLMMSATILDFKLWCRTAGLKEEDVAYLQLDTPFKEENRPVYYAPVGRMSRQHLHKTINKMAEKIIAIMNEHDDEKGIIHTTSHHVARLISERIKDSRLLLHKQGDNIPKLLKKHAAAKKPTVLISPALTEGIDLSEDLSRFQIIAKLPFKNLGDPIVQARMNSIDGWYACCTARSIMQASGRSVRSEKDRAVTYILDECFYNFLARHGTLFPKSFVNAIRAK